MLFEGRCVRTEKVELAVPICWDYYCYHILLDCGDVQARVSYRGDIGIYGGFVGNDLRINARLVSCGVGKKWWRQDVPGEQIERQLLLTYVIDIPMKGVVEILDP